MPINQKSATFDALLLLKDAVAVTASGVGQVAAVNIIRDLGASRLDARVILDVSAIKTTATDESYRFRVQLSNSLTFAASVVTAASVELGAPSATGNTIATPVGRYEVPFSTEVNGVTYRYARLSFVIAGTAPTVTNSAYIVKES